MIMMTVIMKILTTEKTTNMIIIVIMMMNTTRVITIHNNDNHLIKGSTSKDNIQHGAVGGSEILIIAKDWFLIILIKHTISKVLEQYFQKTQYPDVYTREELAQRSVLGTNIVLLSSCKSCSSYYFTKFKLSSNQPNNIQDEAERGKSSGKIL